MKRLTAPLVLVIGLCLGVFVPATALGAAPTVSLGTISGVTTESAILEGTINPKGKAASYRFEYGLADCESSSCTSVPVPEGVLAKGEVAVPVSAEAKGLAPGTTYHFRLVAKNGDGETKGPDRTFMTYLPPQEFGPCSNDQLRLDNPAEARIEYSSANLPDCRAYEQASPIDKDAGDAAGTAPYVRASDDGSSISYLSVSGIPGGKGSQEFPPFLSTGGSSWLTRGLLPPGDTGQQAAVLGWSPDFSQIYTKATQLGEPPQTNFMVSSPGGEPTEIAPYLNGLSPDFAGASEEGDQVIFESPVAIPGVTGAIAGKSNVYLWDKASGQLSLADVMNDGQAPPAGGFAGSYDWLHGTSPTTLNEGGAAARYYLQAQHAISADGSAVYFTAAGTGQLYARLNPTQPQSALDGEGNCTQEALACTVQLSESRRTIPDPAGSRPAAFMGASADGSKALFTSSEMLTDNANTGPEQKPATIERAEKDGTNVDPDLVLTHGTAIAVDATHLYWINPETGAIERAKLDGSDVESTFITATDNPRGVFVANGEIYWTNAAKEVEIAEDETEVIEGTIGRAKLNGEGPASEVEQDFIEEAGNPHAVTADAEHVFWTNELFEPSSYIGQADVDGSNVASRFYKIPGSGRSQQISIIISNSYAYFLQTNDDNFSRISRVHLDGSGFETAFIFLGQNVDAKGLATDGTHIYWSEQTPETIGKAKLNGEGAATEVEPELIKGANHPGGVAVDGTHIYWTANGESLPNPGNDLYLYDTKAKTLSDLVPDSADEEGIDVKGVLGTSADASWVYFAANGVPNGVTGSPNANGEVAEAGDCEGVLGQGRFGPPATGVCNLYLAHGGEVRFIARLDSSRGESETDALNWAATPKQVFPNSVLQKTSRVSPDGQALLFRSQRRLTAYDNEGTSEYYLYRAEDGQVRCVSCNPTGEGPSGTRVVNLGSITTPVVFPTPPASTLSHNLSANGKRVFFETTDALVGADTNAQGGCPFTGADLQAFPACTDTYEWEAEGEGSCDAAHAVADGGCLYLISTGKGKEPQLIADASADGKEVYFFTRSRLVGQDEDELFDVYGAKVDGGLLSQNGPPANPCQSVDSCHGAQTSQPTIEPPPKFSGPGNPPKKGKKPQACPKGKHKVKGRCVPKKKHKAKKHHKGKKGKANSKGRAGR